MIINHIFNTISILSKLLSISTALHQILQSTNCWIIIVRCFLTFKDIKNKGLQKILHFILEHHIQQITVLPCVWIEYKDWQYTELMAAPLNIGGRGGGLEDFTPLPPSTRWICHDPSCTINVNPHCDLDAISEYFSCSHRNLTVTWFECSKRLQICQHRICPIFWFGKHDYC